MTLNFELATCFLFVTHPLVMITVCAILFINSNIDDQVMDGHEQDSLESMHRVSVQTVTHTFDYLTTSP